MNEGGDVNRNTGHQQDDLTSDDLMSPVSVVIGPALGSSLQRWQVL